MAKFISKSRFVMLILLLIFSIIAVKTMQGTVDSGFNIGITLMGIYDTDRDGINDTEDFLTWNSTNITTNMGCLNITINNSANLTQIFNGTLMVNITNCIRAITEFNWTFNSTNVLNLANLTINLQSTTDKGALEIKNLNLKKMGFEKIIYIDDLNASLNGVCIMDMENVSYNDISSSCSQDNETIAVCDGSSYSGYVCTDLGDILKVTGLEYSAAIESCRDVDGDGYGIGCAAGTDCNDNDANINPGTSEVCSDSVDNDCDGSIDEDCTGVSVVTTGGGGGGGGGSIGVTTTSDFTIDKKNIKVILRQGQTKEETINIKNTGKTTLNIKTILKPLREFIFSPSSDEVRITLSPDEEQTLNLVFMAKEDQTPNVYTAVIVVKSNTIEKVINVILEIESAKPLFDVDVEVVPQYKSILAGEDILIEVSLFNVRGFGRVDVNLEYSIMDFEDNLITEEHETVAVETQAKFSRELSVPSDIKPGSYVAFVKVTFEDSVGLSSDVFEVKAKTIRLYPILTKGYMSYLILAALIIIVLSVFFAYKFDLLKKRQVPKTKEEERKVIKAETKIQKLEKELSALSAAYKSKFISEQSYQGGKERVEKELERLRNQ